MFRNSIKLLSGLCEALPHTHNTGQEEEPGKLQKFSNINSDVVRDKNIRLLHRFTSLVLLKTAFVIAHVLFMALKSRQHFTAEIYWCLQHLGFEY